MIDKHVSHHSQDLEHLVASGIELVTKNGIEYFNVVCFFVADLCFVKDVIGACSCTSTFGCYHCKLTKNDWSALKKKVGLPKNVKEMVVKGEQAFTILGNNVDHNSPLFSKTQLKSPWSMDYAVCC